MQVYNGPTSEAVVDFQKAPVVQFESVVQHKKLRPEKDHTQEYHKVFPPIQQEIPLPVLHQFNNQAPPPTLTPIVYAHRNNQEIERIPINRPILKQSKPELTSSEYEETTRHTFRVRGRGRARTRPTTSTERVTTRRVIVPSSTPRSIIKQTNEEDEDEFYGFIRHPNFKQQANHVQIASATQQPQYYSNQGLTRPNDFKLTYDNTNLETTTIRFVGEIKPKYPSPTVTTAEANTDAPKPTRRTRIRTNPKKSYEGNLKNHRPTYSDQAEPATRRTSLRSRGRTHYKASANNPRSKSEEEADVEGGNYPKNFFQNKEPSATPSFQITIGPGQDEDDQAPNASILRPTYVKSDEWHEATGGIDDSEG